MRHARFIALACLSTSVHCTAAQAASFGPPDSRFAQIWSTAPSDQLSSDEGGFTFVTTKASDAKVPADVISDALASASANTFRHNLALNALESDWEPARRAAFEDLREARRKYDEALGANDDAHAARFLSLLHRVIDATGRSAARAEPASPVASVYDRAIREAPDANLSRIQDSQTAYAAYRNAFDSFARTMDRAEATLLIDNELARARNAELNALSSPETASSAAE